MKHFVALRGSTLALLVGVAFFSGCQKRAATAAVAQSPSPTLAAPTISLQASPATIAPGEGAVLTWSSSNATQVQVYPGIGDVATQGARTVGPGKSTVYTARATGPGGTATATASVMVSVASTANATPNPTLEQLFQQNVSDVYFDYDKSELRPDARDALTRDGEFLRAHPQIHFAIEGHCDERGGEEYNLALGANRAASAKRFLVSLGLPANQIQTVSLGKERPFCTEENESCYHQNRRGHFVMER